MHYPAGKRRPAALPEYSNQSALNDAKNFASFVALEIRKPREGFFYIFYLEQADTYWIVPSLELMKLIETKKGSTKKNTDFFINKVKDGIRPRPRFQKYENEFHLLEWK